MDSKASPAHTGAGEVQYELGGARSTSLHHRIASVASLLLCLNAASFGTTVAADADEAALQVGAGTRSCAQFERDYSENPEFFELVYFSWAQGYLSGFWIAASSKNPDPTHDLMPQGRGESWQRSFIREYCQEHPLSPYSEAVATLNLELAKSQKREPK
jgi:hypothetical protein